MDNIVAIVLSAGRGSRMNSDIPKQYMNLHEKPVIFYSLKAFEDSPVSSIVLVAGADVGMKLLGLTEHQLMHPVETLATGAYQGLRLIPYHAVGQPGGMLLAVRFQKARIGNNTAQPLVAFAPERIARGEVYQMLTGGVV